MYKMELKPGVFIITVSGFVKEYEAQAFIKDYKENVKKFDPSQTDLILDGSKLATSAPNTLPTLEACLKMYVADNFKNIYLTEFESITATIQLRNLNAAQFFSKIKMCKSVTDAMSQL